MHKSGGGSDTSSQSADEVYGDTKGRTEGLDKGWTEPGDFTGLKGSQRSPVLSPQKGLSTVEDLEAFLESSGKSAADYRNQMKPKEARSKVIDGILASRTDCKECKPVYEKYQKIFFKKTKEKFKQEHRRLPGMKSRRLPCQAPGDKDSTQKELQEEQETLLEEIAELKVPLTEVQEDLKKLRDIRYWVRKATPGTEESKEPPKKQPIKEVLQDKADEKKAQRTPRHRRNTTTGYGTLTGTCHFQSENVRCFSYFQGGIDLNVFEAVKQSVTTRQAAEHYGIHVGRNGMACCPFHNDKTPSMKLDRRYHCFGCGADGDVIDFAAALYGLGKKEAAVQLAQDFGLSYEDWKPPGKAKKPKPRQKSPEEQFQEAKNRCFRILPIISTCFGHGERICPALPGGSLSSPVCGSLTEARPSGISAGCAAVRGDRGKSGFDYGLRKGCDTA